MAHSVEYCKRNRIFHCAMQIRLSVCSCIRFSSTGSLSYDLKVEDLAVGLEGEIIANNSA